MKKGNLLSWRGREKGQDRWKGKTDQLTWKNINAISRTLSNNKSTNR
jgi:hypothetical protein